MPAPDKPAIVLAPYGTLYSPALATYDRIRAAYERAFPGSPVRLAFTSRLMIRRLAEKEGIAVPDIPAALNSLKGEAAARPSCSRFRSSRAASFTWPPLPPATGRQATPPSTAWPWAFRFWPAWRTAGGFQPLLPALLEDQMRKSKP